MCADWRTKNLPDKEISNRYLDGESACSIAKSYNTYHHTIIRHLKNQGIKIRPRYPDDCNFFDKWSEKMAYVFGYWFADGWMSGSRYRIGISSKDISHLEKMIDIIGYGARMRYRKNHVSSIMIDNKHAWNTLLSLGGLPRKSKNAKLPIIPKKYLNHFVRGLFDGDGTVVISKTGYPTIGFASGTKSFLQELEQVLPLLGNTITVSNFGATYSLCYFGKSAQKILEYIYGSCNIYLDRKYNRYKTAMKWDGKSIGPRNWWTYEEISQLLYLRELMIPYKDISDILNNAHNAGAIRTKYSEMIL